MPPGEKNTIKENISAVRKEIEQKAIDLGLCPQEITLIAVSKGQSYEQIKEAYAVGIRDFGESYAQEMQQKIILAQKDGLTDIRWHYIGAIQTNKINLIKQADVIHSLSSLKHAELLSQKTKKELKTFLQINLDDNQIRQGAKVADVLTLLRKIKTLPNLKIIGLMAILPSNRKIKPSFWFQKMADLKEIVKHSGLLQTVALSMGMSRDFKDAIGHGATYVRIGTRIFQQPKKLDLQCQRISG